MMTTTSRRWAALLSAGALSLSLTACGGGDDDAPASPSPTTAPAVTDEATTDAGETTDSEATTDAAAPTTEETTEESTEAAAEGEIPVADFIAMLKEPGEEKLSSYEMTMDLKAGGEAMEMSGKVDLSGDSPAMAMDMEIPGAGPMTMIMADGRMFMSMAGVTEDGKFMEVPKEQLGEAATALDDVDLASQYEDWEKSAKRVVLVGEEDVDGTTMRHYEVVLDGQAAIDAAGVTGDDEAAVSAAIGDEFVYDVWLDDDNLMRRIVMEIEGMVTEIKADKWGEPVDVEAPSEDQLMSTPTG